MGQISKAALPLALLIAVAGHGQSLADAARQNKAKKDQSTTTTKKVYTTDDLSPSPDAAPEANTSEKTPDAWKRQILAQKGWVTFPQGQADRLAAATPKGFTDPQAAKAQEQVVQEKEKLQQLQAAAQQAGMPSSVYDPSRPVRFMNSSAGARRYMNSLNAGH
jgi:hypothetical protein